MDQPDDMTAETQNAPQSDNIAVVPPTPAAADAADVFDLSEMETVDADWMTVNHPKTGVPTTWKVLVAGPGHPETEKLKREAQTERLAKAKRIENAQVNGKKWKGEEIDPEAEERKTIDRLSRRILDWTPVEVNRQPFPYSRENARLLLADPKWSRFYEQLIDYLGGDSAFMKGSADT